ncbi:MAG: glycyl-radical enzyme activating protein [Clostridia bacterium]|nr:glycyl-radical enzyme activating protein [Clostridia bacterium]
MKGMIFNIQRFCINDGPGIRTTVFFKGCPLNCKWCHNPESQSPDIEIMRDNGSDEICGTYMTVQDVMDEVLKDKVFYKNSGGGLTLSGGEPLMQFEFAYELLKQAKQNGIHTCVETCGFSTSENISKIAEFTDIFLYDWKLTNNKLHNEYTGVSNDLILENLKQIDEDGSKIILKCPIIPNVNDTKDHFQGIANISNSLKNILAIEIEPYHSLAKNKYIRLGKEEAVYSFEQPDEQQIEIWIAQFQKYTNVIVKKA